MTDSRHLHLRFLQGSFLADDATYGSATYGEPLYTYGPEPTQTVIPGIDYDVLPSPGWHPQEPGWVFRIGDTTRFACVIIDKDAPDQPIDVSSIFQAHLILNKVSFDSSPYAVQYDLLPDPATNQLYRDWLPQELIVQGRFRVSIRILFLSDRYLSIEANDELELQVNAADIDLQDDLDPRGIPSPVIQ